MVNIPEIGPDLALPCLRIHRIFDLTPLYFLFLVHGPFLLLSPEVAQAVVRIIVLQALDLINMGIRDMVDLDHMPVSPIDLEVVMRRI